MAVAKRTRRRHSLAALSGVACFAFLQTLTLPQPASAAATERAQSFSIPPQPLGPALLDFGIQAGLVIAFPDSVIAGLRTQGVSGPMPVQEALRRLLAGTGLEFEFVDAKSVRVVRRATQLAPGRREATASTATIAGGLDEIVVTAQKRAQDAQLVPITLTAFSAETIDRRNIRSIRDLASYTPGFNAAQFSNDTPIFAIRGAENTFSAAGATKPTGIFVDEVYIPRASASNFSLFDAQSVSVLKGPQGTLFGRNVTAGAILVQTREPSLSDTDVNARAGIGNYNLREASAYASMPFSENIAGSVAVNREVHDGYGRDILNGREEDNADSWAGRAQILFKPSDAFKLRLTADYGHDQNNGRVLSSLQFSDANRRTSELGLPQTYDRDIGGGSGRVDFGDGSVKLTSLTGYRYSNSFETFARSGLAWQSLPSGFQEMAEERERDSAFSQEGRLSYDDQALNLVGGVFYFREKSRRDFRKYRLAARTGATILDNFYAQDVKTTSAAPFADLTWHVTDTFDLTGGARYSFEHKDASMALTNRTAPASNFIGTDEHDWSQLTWRAVATWRPWRSVTLYGSYATGFTAGGYNTEADFASAFHTPFNPEKSKNFELGLKSRFADDRGRFNLAAFSTKYRDKQEFVFNSLTLIGNIINAAQATVRGVEAELAFSPFAALTLNGTFAYLHAKYDRFDIPGAASATGNPLGNSPRITYSLAADYDQPLSWGRLLASVSLAHKGTYRPSATLPAVSPATDLLNAQLGVASLDDQWRLVLWGRNLTDQRYPLITSTTSVNSEWLAPPSTYGVRISYRY